MCISGVKLLLQLLVGGTGVDYVNLQNSICFCCTFFAQLMKKEHMFLLRIRAFHLPHLHHRVKRRVMMNG